ncbi:Type II secretion system protein G [BD1-7 clade bacterium]|uniref:Type II secretion system protein G n=1 Tax=BD1-7 clade bacterium TaxID=2029982 RepID=A0A5S9QXW9_9GAMM|nr:Type II secretion system protein G [BD1-7 clade bacterium]
MSKIKFSNKNKVLLVIIILFSLLASIFFLFSLRIVHKNDADLDVARLTVLQSSLSIYKERFEKYPNSELGLEELMSGGKEQRIIEPTMPLIDKWGSKFVFRNPSECGNAHYDLYSLGENLKDECGKGDDLMPIPIKN